MILTDAAPLLLLLGLLASGRVAPLPACLFALIAALPALWLREAEGLVGFLWRESLAGAFLALPPVLIVAGGLLFQAAIAGGQASAMPRPATPARIFAVSLPGGAFLESVTGFSIGAVFALGALMAMGVRGVVAVALSVQALTLVPWGGLGPGTALGAAIAGVPGQAVGAIAAWPAALWLLLLLPLQWRLQAMAGAAPPAAERAVQAGLTLLLGALLILAHRLLPFELAGVVAAGPVAALALWRADRPARPVAAAAPYLLLLAALLAARAVPGVPLWRPYPELPGFALNHVAVVLLAVALLLLLWHGRADRAGPALARALRPGAALLLYVVLGRWLAEGGIAADLAAALAGLLGPAAPVAIAPMALLSGIVTGTNVGSNAALMPVQHALGQAMGLDPALVAALHNVAGGAGAGMGAAGLAMLCALVGDGTRPAQAWRLLLPSMAAVLAAATLALWWWGGARPAP
ncbi:MAG: L-lactate permease [Roseococcus sp.]|nr:L-lactate permease [Roseococcus sp.]